MSITIQQFYRIFWHVVLLTAEFIEGLVWLRSRIKDYIVNCLNRHQKVLPKEQHHFPLLEESDRLLLENAKRNLTKIPKHVNLIIARDTNFERIDSILMRVLNYALMMDIECLSFSDCRLSTSIIKSNYISGGGRSSTKDTPLQLDNLRCPKQMHCKRVNEYHAIWYQPTYNNRTESMSNGYCRKNPEKVVNGIRQHSLLGQNGQDHKSKSLKIYEIHHRHGRPLLAEVCQSLYRGSKNHSSANGHSLLSERRDKIMEKINLELASHLDNFSEPDLTIIFDEHFCVYGLLPWHMRFTEFHLANSKQGSFLAQDFIGILYKYARCEQRFGK